MKNNKNLFWSSLILSVFMVFGLGFFVNTNALPNANYYNLTITSENTTTEVFCEDVLIESGENILEDSILTIFVTSNTGYTLDTFTVNGQEFTSGDTFTVSENVFIFSTATANQYNVSIVNLTNASFEIQRLGDSILTNESSATAYLNCLTYGVSYTFIATANSGFEITTCQLNFNDFTSGNNFNCSGNLTINVIAELIPGYTTNLSNCSVSVVYNGVVVDSTTDRLVIGNVYTITATATTGHTLDTILVNGETFTNGSSWTCNSPLSITATANLSTYNVSLVNLRNASFEIKQGTTTILTSYSPSSLFFNCLIFGETYTFLATPNGNSNLITCQLNFEDFTSGDNFTCNGDLTINLIAESTNVPPPTFSLTVDLTCSYATFYYSIDNGETFLNVNSTKTLILPNIPVSTFLFYAVADFGIYENVDYHYSCMGEESQVDFGGNNEPLNSVQIDLTNVAYMSISIASWD